ncbi:MAG TPA: AAA family ATPase, partial [Candidatus Nanoarchaeia archaeon]|nr:AAA family ATPase [Candidatus Nanoarchaeia archaeon]
MFQNRAALQSNFLPETIIHRELQLEQLGNTLAPALKLNRPSNLFIYGKTGTGKTITTQHFIQKLQSFVKAKQIPLMPIYINCKLKRVADTEYRIIAQLIQAFGREIPSTGLPTQEIYKYFYELVESKPQLILLFLDEIDELVKKSGEEILYNLTRINGELKKSQVGIVGISNDLMFTANLDPRIKSSLSEEEILFHPYNALQIQDILRQRAAQAFTNDALATGVIEKCAAYAAKEHGDARRALELLRVAGEIAERERAGQIRVEHLDRAE